MPIKLRQWADEKDPNSGMRVFIEGLDGASPGAVVWVEPRSRATPDFEMRSNHAAFSIRYPNIDALHRGVLDCLLIDELITEEQYSAPSFSMFLSAAQRKRGEPVSKSSESIDSNKVSVLQAVNGIDRTAAARLIRVFGSVRQVAVATDHPEKLQELGLSEVQISSLQDALN